MYSKFNLSKYFSVLAVVLLVIAGFFIAQSITIFFLQIAFHAGLLSHSNLDSAGLQFSATAVSYLLALVIIIGLFQLLTGPIKDIKKLLGISARPKISNIYYLLDGYCIYFVFSLVFIILAQLLFGGFDSSEAQLVGFNQLGSNAEYIMAFLALVVLAPIFEEVIFRGFLFTKIRQKINFWWTAFIVSLVFGVVHLQWNVGIDVFALSLVLCYLRERTGTVWTGIGVHMLKNGLAFSILFLDLDIQRLIT